MPAPADATWNRDAPFPLCLSQFLTIGLMRNDQSPCFQLPNSGLVDKETGAQSRGP